MRVASMDAIIKTGGPFVAMLYLLQCYKSLYDAPIFVRVAFLPLLWHNFLRMSIFMRSNRFIYAQVVRSANKQRFFRLIWWLICLLFY